MLNLSNSDNEEEDCIFVITRTGKKERLDTNKIVRRLEQLIKRPPKINHISSDKLMVEIVKGLKSGITTKEIDEYTAEVLASNGLNNPNNLKLASRVAIDNHIKNTQKSFIDKMKLAYYNQSNGNINSLVSKEFIAYVEEHQDFIESTIDYSRDFLMDYFGFNVFINNYSIKVNNKPIERIQDMYMRTAVALHMNSKYNNLDKELDLIKKTYDALSLKHYTQASPTYFNAGTNNPQYASCFLLGTADSREGIMKTADDSSQISKWAGGLGIHVNCWRGTGSTIRGTNGKSSGIAPFLKILNSTMLAFNQGGKRPGSAAIYLMPHHPDIITFLELRLIEGEEKSRARDLFYAVWLPDIFMERYKEKDGIWSLFDPDTCGDLSDYCGNGYTERYLLLEKEKKYVRQIKAKEIMDAIIKANQQKGMPYICFSDTANKTSMQKNLGVIKSSNLCVSEDTLVLTDKGYYNIKELSETSDGIHNVYNGESFKPARFAKTNTDQKLLNIKFSDGCELKCTKEHKFMLSNGYNRNGVNNFREVMAKDLVIDDKLIKYEFPIIDNDNDNDNNDNDNDNNGNTKTIPINYSINTKLKWLAEYIDANGYMKNNNNEQYLYTTSINKEFLMNVKFLCNTLGTNPIVDKINIGDNTCDINDDEKLIFINKYTNNVKICYRLCFSVEDTGKLYNMGLDTKRISFNNKVLPMRSKKQYIRVISIEELPNNYDTYCFNEPTKHSGIFNGVLTKNCSEIILYSSDKEYAVCNLCSVSLSSCVVDKYTKEELELSEEKRRILDNEFPLNPHFDYNKLIETTKLAVINLNNIIDRTYYSVKETKLSNMRHRPIGIGIQGLADAYIKMRYPYESAEARRLNKNISETMYFAALSQSTTLCREEYLNAVKTCKEIGSYEVITYRPNDYKDYPIVYKDHTTIPKNIGSYGSMLFNGGSPISKGIFRWELSENVPMLKDNILPGGNVELCGKYDWETLREHIKEFGVKNSVLMALMPTASTSILMGNNECFEPYTTNVYKRKTNAGEYTVINKYLMHDLYKLGIYNDNIKTYLKLQQGSIQHIEGITEDIKKLYKTAYEIDQLELIRQAADRQPFIDQAQSLNWYMESLNSEQFVKLIYKAWRWGLITAKYYLHTSPAVKPQSFTIDPRQQELMNKKIEELKLLKNNEVTKEEDEEKICLVCSG